MLKAAGKIYLRCVMPKYQDILRKKMALRENNVIQVSKIDMAAGYCLKELNPKLAEEKPYLVKDQLKRRQKK